MTKVELATKTGVETNINTKIKTKRSTKTKTDAEITAMTEIEVGLEKEVICLKQGKVTSQRLKKSTKSYDS